MSGLLFVPTLWLLLLGYKTAGLAMLAVTLLSALVVIRFTHGGTKISVRGSTLKYDTSQIVDLQDLKEISQERQFDVEDILMLQGENINGPVSMRGIPSDARFELIDVLAERINTD